MGAIIGSPPAYQNQRPSGKLYLANAQDNLVNGADTLVLLDTIPAEFIDGIENVGTHRITPGIAGWYSFVGQVTFFTAIADGDYVAFAKLSGNKICEGRVHASKNGNLSAIVSLPCQYFNAANFLELWAISNSGGNTVDILQSVTGVFTFLSVQRVR